MTIRLLESGCRASAGIVQLFLQRGKAPGRKVAWMRSYLWVYWMHQRWGCPSPWGTPIAGWLISWHIPTKNGWWLGVPLFQETSIWIKITVLMGKMNGNDVLYRTKLLMMLIDLLFLYTFHTEDFDDGLPYDIYIVWYIHDYISHILEKTEMVPWKWIWTCLD